MSDNADLVQVLIAVGTVGAALVAATSVVISGRQGAAQRRLLVEAQQRDVAERRADFELGLLLDLSRLTRSAWRWQPMGLEEDRDQARALLLALPPDLLPVLRARTATLDDTLATEVLARYRGQDFARELQRAIDRELRDAVFARLTVGSSAPPGESRHRVWWKPTSWRRNRPV